MCSLALGLWVGMARRVLLFSLYPVIRDSRMRVMPNEMMMYDLKDIHDQ